MTKIVIIILLIIFVILTFSYFQNKKYKLKLRKLHESRPNLTRVEYINLLENRGFNKHHIEVVYNEISDFIQMNDFSMYPEDDIHEIYKIDDLDDISLIESICKKLKLKKFEQKDIDEVNKSIKIFNAEYILTLTKKLAE